jgi:hypothetical protein
MATHRAVWMKGRYIDIITEKEYGDVANKNFIAGREVCNPGATYFAFDMPKENEFTIINGVKFAVYKGAFGLAADAVKASDEDAARATAFKAALAAAEGQVEP